MSPKSASLEPIWPAFFIGRKGSDPVSPQFFQQKDQQRERDGYDTEMHEDVVAGSEDYVYGVNIGQYEANHDFGGDPEVHVKVMHSLRKD